MQPFQYDLRSPAAKYKSITYAAAAPSNLDAAITMQSADAELQNAKELRATASEIAAPKPDLHAKAKKTILKHFLRAIWKGKSPAPYLRKSHDKSPAHPWCSHSNTIYGVQLRNYYARSRGTKQPWRSHYNAIRRRWVAKHKRTTCKNVGKETHEPSVPLRSAENELRNSSKDIAKTTPEQFSKLSCKSQKNYAEKQRSFRARRPSNSNSWRCENKAFVRGLLQIPTVQDMKTKLSCETSFKFQKVMMWNEAFVRDLLQILKVEVMKRMPELAVPLRGRSDHDPPLSERVPHPSAEQASQHIIRATFCPAKHSISCIRAKMLSCETTFAFHRSRCENEAFVWDIFQIPTCNWSCENTAFVRDILQIPTGQDMKTKLSC